MFVFTQIARKGTQFVVIFRKTPTFAVLQTALRSDFSSLPLFKGLHYYVCGKFTFPAKGRAPRQIGGLFRKMRFSETQVNYLDNLAKKQKRRFLLFHPVWQCFALREEGEFAPLRIMCAPKRAQRAEKPLPSRQYNMSANNGVALKSRKTAGVSSPRFS